MGQVSEMRFCLAPAKAEAVDARGARPTIADGVIGVARLAGFETAFALFHELSCRGRRSDLLCAIGHKLKPLQDEALGCGPDAMGTMLYNVPKIIERPAADDRLIKV